MQSQRRGWMILALFFCSGATALVYEVVWSKLLAQMFGSTIYAQTVVLAVFMGGLALGNRLLGFWADRLRSPVQVYGCLEIAVGVYAFLFMTFDGIVNHIFIALGTPIVAHPKLLLVLNGALAAALLLGPTIMMGGTLPLLAAWLQRFYTDAGRRSARFYSVNSLGAVLGAALAGFYLVQTFGIVATLQITAAVNVTIGVTAILLGRYGLVQKPATVEPGAPPAPATGPEAALPATLRWAGLIVATTGAVSMGFEVLASRSLAMIFGSSLQSFAVVLISFILGIGLGSAWIASPRRHGRSSERIIILLLCIAAAWVTLLVFNIEQWVNFYRMARTGLARTPTGYVYHELLTVGISLVILGLPAAWIGAVLPLMIRAVSHEGSLLGEKVGILLTWNTLGAVVGVMLTGFVVMPWVGLRDAFGVLALVLALGALVIAVRRFWPAGIAGALLVCLFTGSLFVISDTNWQYVMSSGIFRVWETRFDSGLMDWRKKHIQIVFYQDGPDATVSVERVDGIAAAPMLGLRTNGKPEAGTRLDLGTQLLVTDLPILSKPGAKDVFVLGLASGMTAGATLAFPIERLDVAENCDPVIRASELFTTWNRQVLSDPRTHLWREDARTVLKLRPQQYDVIITEPSNPWFVATGSVFSREYYELAASRLKPGGIMAQWFQIYETRDDIVKLVLRTFNSVFPYVEIWDAGSGDIVILGSKQPWPSGPDVFRKGFAIERVRTDMEMIDIDSPEALMARQLASQQTGFAIADRGPVQSDLSPILEYEAPRAFYLSTGTQVLDPFDERTYQQLLAPAEKREILHSLPTPAAQVVFSDFLTVNGELYGSLFGNPANANVPCVFQTATASPPPGASGTILDQAEQAFSRGDLPEAQRLAALALEQTPDDAVAGYVARVIERAEQTRPAAGLATIKRATGTLPAGDGRPSQAVQNLVTAN
ncbi:MAG: fused MFS/spermidine synthase [Verrucomicrobiota bacterium]